MPLLDNDVLRSFIAIAEHGTFTSAAKAVHRTPSALSMQIKQLEQNLGKTLFILQFLHLIKTCCFKSIVKFFLV